MWLWPTCTPQCTPGTWPAGSVDASWLAVLVWGIFWRNIHQPRIAWNILKAFLLFVSICSDCLRHFLPAFQLCLLQQRVQDSRLYASLATLYTLHSTLYTPLSALYTLHSTLYTLLYSPHSTLHTPHSLHYTPHFTFHTLHFTLHTPHFTLYTVYSTLYTLHFTLHTLHFPVVPHKAVAEVSKIGNL